MGKEFELTEESMVAAQVVNTLLARLVVATISRGHVPVSAGRPKSPRQALEGDDQGLLNVFLLGSQGGVLEHGLQMNVGHDFRKHQQSSAHWLDHIQNILLENVDPPADVQCVSLIVFLHMNRDYRIMIDMRREIFRNLKIPNAVKKLYFE